MTTEAGVNDQAGQSNSALPSCFLIIHNVAKRHNIGNIARSASAFGVAKICLVGSRQFNAFGSQGAAEYVSFLHFPTLEKCCKSLREDEGCKIIGVEITDGAQAVHTHPFTGPTAFMIGNEGTGLSEKQMRLCDSFVYIPQYGDGTASLNVTVATSIVLQHFAVWAGYQEHQRNGYKFIVGQRPPRTHSRGVVARTDKEAAEEQQRRQQRGDGQSDLLQQDSIGDTGGVCGGMFSDDDNSAVG